MSCFGKVLKRLKIQNKYHRHVNFTALSEPQYTSTPLKKTDLNGHCNGNPKLAIDVDQMETLLEHQDTNVDIDGALYSKGNLSTNSKVPLVQKESPDPSPSGTTSSGSVTSEPSLTEEVCVQFLAWLFSENPEILL